MIEVTVWPMPEDRGGGVWYDNGKPMQAWLNPAHVMAILPAPGAPNLCYVVLANGLTYKVCEDPQVLAYRFAKEGT